MKQGGANQRRIIMLDCIGKSLRYMLRQKLPIKSDVVD